MNIKKLYHQYKFKKTLKLYKDFYKIDSSTILNNGFNIRLDKPCPKLFLTINKDCIIGGQFIFESETGFISIDEHSYIGGSTFICHSRIEM